MVGRIPLIPAGASIEERLRALTDRSGGDDACWLWLRSVDKDGYGKMQVNKRTVRPHRLALELDLGRPVQGLVLHSCDTPRCCNPRHLSEGTQLENRQQAKARGRTAKGERSGVATVSDWLGSNALWLVLGAGLSQADASRATGVSRSWVWQALHRKNRGELLDRVASKAA